METSTALELEPERLAGGVDTDSVLDETASLVIAPARRPKKDWLEEQVAWLQETQKKATEAVAQYARSRPLASVAIAAAAGFLIGRIR
jgi:ElaB/YqjD/DUF883 family membrane-anchored ribosome-binding protein